ncbi:MAG TPA: beta-L-arabinofuranosidase domain-containing protein [Puia sp.]|nr:beta-L-arabinofuranosidase domain-containing protein [Puia sp.]
MRIPAYLIAIFIISYLPSHSQQPNRAPLRPNPYISLPLGAIQPQGWLRQMLLRQASGATGHLDELYPSVMGPRNGWRGGDGDQWERGPYWLDGLVPLAYILHDTALIAKTRPFIEWTLNSQQPDGYFGPARDYPGEPGLQRDNCHDWWPHMVMLKVLQQYYSATRDPRVIRLMTNYFHYQLRQLPIHPLDHWTFWARFRAGDNLQAVYWLYNLTGDAALLQLADLLHKQTFDYTDAFLHTHLLSTDGAIHGVNLAEGLKEPLVYYQQHPEQRYLDALDKGLADLRRFDGMPFGLFGADESIHGNDPTQGSELCTAVEMMYTLETMLRIKGSTSYADGLERIAFNALPTQIDSNFMTRQYFQQANQVMITRHYRNFDVNHDGTDVCYGLFTGYPCCTSNMHQGWPKYTQNLWYATPDGGLAAMVYAPNVVTTRIGGKTVTISEETTYPFEETIRFRIDLAGAAKFPLKFRVPGWCKNASVTVNGAAWPTHDSLPARAAPWPTHNSPAPKAAASPTPDSLITINRVWSSGDRIELTFPMTLTTHRWHENAASIERGPLVYALKIGETTRQVQDTTGYGSFTEIRPTTPWNYGLPDVSPAGLQTNFSVSTTSVSPYPWTASSAPITIHAKARRLPDWGLYNESAGPQPYSNIYQQQAADSIENVTLIPYGCTHLRISEFPVVGGER